MASPHVTPAFLAKMNAVWEGAQEIIRRHKVSSQLDEVLQMSDKKRKTKTATEADFLSTNDAPEAAPKKRKVVKPEPVGGPAGKPEAAPKKRKVAKPEPVGGPAGKPEAAPKKKKSKLASLKEHLRAGDTEPEAAPKKRKEGEKATGGKSGVFTEAVDKANAILTALPRRKDPYVLRQLAGEHGVPTWSLRVAAIRLAEAGVGKFGKDGASTIYTR